MTLPPPIAPARATVIAALAAIVALLAFAGPALAADNSIARGHREIDQSRVLLARSLDVYKTGDHDRAYALSKQAYLDHFEFVEIPRACATRTSSSTPSSSSPRCATTSATARRCRRSARAR